MAEQNNKWVNMCVQSSNAGTAFTVAFGQSGVIRYTNGSTWAVRPTYSFGIFYDIKIVANTNTYKYDLYIGGVNVASNIDFYSQQTDIQNIYFGTTAPLSAVYFDNVQVSKN